MKFSFSHPAHFQTKKNTMQNFWYIVGLGTQNPDLITIHWNINTYMDYRQKGVFICNQT